MKETNSVHVHSSCRFCNDTSERRYQNSLCDVGQHQVWKGTHRPWDFARQIEILAVTEHGPIQSSWIDRMESVDASISVLVRMFKDDNGTFPSYFRTVRNSSSVQPELSSELEFPVTLELYNFADKRGMKHQYSHLITDGEASYEPKHCGERSLHSTI